MRMKIDLEFGISGANEGQNAQQSREVALLYQVREKWDRGRLRKKIYKISANIYKFIYKNHKYLFPSVVLKTNCK